MSLCDDFLSPWLAFSFYDFLPTKEKGDNWMIRNFTKREYVISVYHLTQMLYSLIGHFASGSPTGGWLAHGDWAGNRIDITLVSIHKRDHGDGSDWKDITDGVKEKLRALFREEGCEHRFRL
ncbi:hypothetical protein EV361DRAFT_872460 [Lentinula raphanica]|uniref:Uncharacterized protein n=1 Tax=Lentinula raphanica TaxID=153919 RepID=A0AA38P3L9_9AGAR|nr:hypothetical protein F5880DRAFT_1509179 [Lentinula raphanica]KAJ3835698.1 hypothetical protein F5878DRAFT_644136 [Lentinula raphanica]KAJ3966360.1 hypothetical protein EV361DRAFT_872460 [Lentinula raphanica]